LAPIKGTAKTQKAEFTRCNTLLGCC